MHRSRRWLWVTVFGAAIAVVAMLIATAAAFDKDDFGWMVGSMFLMIITSGVFVGSVLMLIGAFMLPERKTWRGIFIIVWALIALTSPLFGFLFLAPWLLLALLLPVLIVVFVQLFRKHAAVAALLVFVAVSAFGAKPRTAPLQPMLDRAKANVLDGTYDVQRDLAPLLDRLATTRDENEQDDVLDLIEELGGYDTIMPAAVKSYLRENATPVILNVIRSNAAGSVRTEALMLLRTLNVDAPVLDEAIAIANADTSKDATAVKFRGELLNNWKSTRPANYQAVPTENEQAALEYLRRRHTRISAYSLGTAAREADTKLVAALLDAGVPVDAPQIVGTALTEATSTGCVTNADAPGRLSTIELLLARGANAKWVDGNNNNLVMFALDCPAPVVARLLDAGADLNAVNAMQYNPLQLSLAKGNWEVAELLVARGARLSKKQIDELFFEKPTDADKVALLRRATKK
ncbi:MAG TPA: hypothetical protein VM733_11090 [Thermoanaerobaculia bacterium]|nr:hypothetical protein [Thermoanaerobaculia bacterium]